METQGRLRGDRALGAPGDLGRAADPLADPVVGADRQLVLAQQRPRRVDARERRACVPLVVGDPDAAAAAGAVANRDRHQRLARSDPSLTISQAGSPLSASTKTPWTWPTPEPPESSTP